MQNLFRASAESKLHTFVELHPISLSVPVLVAGICFSWSSIGAESPSAWLPPLGVLSFIGWGLSAQKAFDRLDSADNRYAGLWATAAGVLAPYLASLFFAAILSGLTLIADVVAEMLPVDTPIADTAMSLVAGNLTALSVIASALVIARFNYRAFERLSHACALPHPRAIAALVCIAMALPGWLWLLNDSAGINVFGNFGDTQGRLWLLNFIFAGLGIALVQWLGHSSDHGSNPQPQSQPQRKEMG